MKLYYWEVSMNFTRIKLIVIWNALWCYKTDVLLYSLRQLVKNNFTNLVLKMRGTKMAH